LTDLTGETLRRWRESRGWDVPRMARELRKAAKESGEDVAAHHGLVKMIPQWERGKRRPSERYRLLYLKIFHGALRDPSRGVAVGGLFHGALGNLSEGMAAGVDFALRLADIRSRAARLPSPNEIRALETNALARPRRTMTPAEIRALTAQTISRLQEVASNLAELSALLGDDEANERNEGRS
jgi:transcriptional regulator with XRE-family HTH domain